MIGMAEKPITIHPGAYPGLLAALPVPYSVHRMQAFNLREHVQDISTTYKQKEDGPPTTVDVVDQLEHWQACVESAQTGEGGGWTLAISGPGTITYPECVAAHLALEYLRRGKTVLWLNVTASLGGERDLVKAAGGHGPSGLDALVLTGFRWDGDAVRFDKGFDLIRQSHPRTTRIIVGVGSDPVSLTRYMDIGLNRALCVSEARLVQM